MMSNNRFNPMQILKAWLIRRIGDSGMAKVKNVSPVPAIDSSEQATQAQSDYFQLARTWADDYHTVVSASRNRYRAAFFVAMGLSGLLAASVWVLAEVHEYIPLMVHHYDSGVVTVDQANHHYVPDNSAEIESELVRYIVNRESYDPASFSTQYQLVTLMSDDSVARDYHQVQNSDDPSALMATLGNQFIRTVKVQDVNFLDTESMNQNKKHQLHHKNLAEVNFMVTDTPVHSGSTRQTPYVAIVSWTHEGIPDDPETRWMNWNGFTVTHYQRNQRTL